MKNRLLIMADNHITDISSGSLVGVLTTSFVLQELNLCYNYIGLQIQTILTLTWKNTN